MTTHDAFARAYAEHDGKLRGFIRKHVADHHLVNDLVQETWMKVWRGIDRARPDEPGGLEPWLFTIARNVLTDHWRRSSIRPVSLAGDGTVFAHHPSAAEGPEERAVAAAEWSADLACLPERHQRVMRLRCELEFTEPEMAAALGIPPGTVKSRLFYGRRAVVTRRAAS